MSFLKQFDSIVNLNDNGDFVPLSVRDQMLVIDLEPFVVVGNALANDCEIDLLLRIVFHFRIGNAIQYKVAPERDRGMDDEG